MRGDEGNDKSGWQTTTFIRPLGLLHVMSNNAYDRQKLPHEDDVAFERVLRNISRQEVMPRPMVVGPTEIGRTSHSDLFGDIYHWDNFSLANTVYLFLKYLIELGIASTLPRTSLFNVELEILLTLAFSTAFRPL